MMGKKLEEIVMEVIILERRHRIRKKDYALWTYQRFRLRTRLLNFMPRMWTLSTPSIKFLFIPIPSPPSRNHKAPGATFCCRSFMIWTGKGTGAVWLRLVRSVWAFGLESWLASSGKRTGGSLLGASLFSSSSCALFASSLLIRVAGAGPSFPVSVDTAASSPKSCSPVEDDKGGEEDKFERRATFNLRSSTHVVRNIVIRRIHSSMGESQVSTTRLGIMYHTD